MGGPGGPDDSGRHLVRRAGAAMAALSGALAALLLYRGARIGLLQVVEVVAVGLLSAVLVPAAALVRSQVESSAARTARLRAEVGDCLAVVQEPRPATVDPQLLAHVGRLYRQGRLLLERQAGDDVERPSRALREDVKTWSRDVSSTLRSLGATDHTARDLDDGLRLLCLELERIAA